MSRLSQQLATINILTVAYLSLLCPFYIRKNREYPHHTYKRRIHLLISFHIERGVSKTTQSSESGLWVSLSLVIDQHNIMYRAIATALLTTDVEVTPAFSLLSSALGSQLLGASAIFTLSLWALCQSCNRMISSQSSARGLRVEPMGGRRRAWPCACDGLSGGA